LKHKNYDIGRKGEKRITRLILQELPESKVLDGPKDGYPDLFMRVNGRDYALECKTSLLIKREEGRVQFGWIKIRSSQVKEMMILTALGAIPLLVVEWRSRGRRPFYTMVPWHRVKEKYMKRQPSVLTLMHGWIVDTGTNFRWWLRSLRRAAN
jgi:hypothetical protein